MQQTQQYKFEEDEADAFEDTMDFGVQQAGYEPGQYNEAESRTLRHLDVFSNARGRVHGLGRARTAGERRGGRGREKLDGD